MTEYMVKVRVDDFDNKGKDCIKEMFDEFIYEMLGNAPFEMEIESIENAK